MLQKPLSEDSKVEMNINCFNIESQNSITHVEGNWNLGWKLSNGTAKRVYTLNKKLTINDTVITLESLELTPLSYKLIIDPENYDKVFQLEAIAKETKEDEFKTDENGNYTIVGYIDEEAVDNSLELKEDEGLVPAAEISQLFLEDKLFTGVGGPRSVTINGENSGSFSEVLDLDKVTAFRFGGQKISLTDCDYKTEISYENE